jgi:hypothetical protein
MMHNNSKARALRAAALKLDTNNSYQYVLPSPKKMHLADVKFLNVSVSTLNSRV